VSHQTKAAFADGCARWPTVRGITLATFRSFIADAGIGDDALAEHAGDVYLAAAAVAGHDKAVKIVSEDLLGELPRWLARLRLPLDTVEEVRQVLRSKLLVGPPPRLAQYRASGPLGAWIRVAAVRTALDLGGDGDAIGDETNGRLQDPLLQALDPERQLIRTMYSALFEIALRDAVGEMSKRNRSLLRFHYLAGMSFDAIGRIYHVNRSTAVRWLAAIRDELEAAVKLRLWQELGISTTEFQSLWNAVRSEVEVSLSRLLAAV